MHLKGEQWGWWNCHLRQKPMLLWYIALLQQLIFSCTVKGNDNTNCIDVAGWTDAFGLSCSDYEESSPPSASSSSAKPSLCDTATAVSYNQGYTATQACCACGGGLDIDDMIWEEAKDVPPRPTMSNDNVTNGTGEICLDRPNWDARIGNVTVNCSSFDFWPDSSSGILSCEQYGHFKNNFSTPANDVCCVCGGGYNGTMIGKTFRATFPADADTIYTLYTDTSMMEAHGDGAVFRDGSTVWFMQSVAAALGFGLYNTQISEVARSEYPNDTYAACVLDLELGLTDMCIAPFFNTTDIKVHTDALYEDELILIVPTYTETNYERWMTPVKPFTLDAWIFVCFTCLYMGTVMIILRKPKRGDLAHKNLFQRGCAVLYSSIKSCASGDVHTTIDQPTIAEMIIISGFTIFGLIILTAYTATSAAFLISVGKNIDSLDDILESSSRKICMSNHVESMFLEEYPESINNVVAKSFNTRELVENVGSDECYAAVVSSSSFLVLLQYDESICDGVKIIYDNGKPYVVIDLIIPVTPNLGEMAQELIDAINVLIEKGVYSTIHGVYEDNFEQGELDDRVAVSRQRNLKGGKKAGSTSKATAAAGGGSSTAVKFSGTSCDEDVIDLEKFQLTALHLLMPISFSILCTSVGIIMFFVQRAKDSKIVIRQTGSIIVLTEETEDALLRRELEDAKPYDILLHLREVNSVNVTDVKAAINDLPDRKKLIELAFKSLCSQRKNHMELMNELNFSDLCILVEYFKCHVIDVEKSLDADSSVRHSPFHQRKHEEESDCSHTSITLRPQSDDSDYSSVKKGDSPEMQKLNMLVRRALNDPEDPKLAIIRHMLDSDLQVLKRIALRCARIKQKYDSDGKSFEIQKHLGSDEDNSNKGGRGRKVMRRIRKNKASNNSVQESSLSALHYMNRRNTYFRTSKSYSEDSALRLRDSAEGMDGTNEFALRSSAHTLRSINLKKINASRKVSFSSSVSTISRINKTRKSKYR
mmetsp:Transcript_21736/g.33227  ORF Transcript_21736/g.33227 Transcript_21736/m.33227 type:complete len:989 (-) Transcript_21736:869-3835(-)